jgi:aminoglycoside/choline kinase family phosphotransferase
VAGGSYRTEIAFYRELAPTVAIRAPRCWASWLNDDRTDFVLLLEDLAPRRQGDQIRGCTAAEAIAAAVNLAGLHGPRWCDPSLEGTAGLTAIAAADAEMLADALAPMTGRFVEGFGDRLPAADREILERVAPVVGSWISGRPERFGPVHGDYRLDNLLFSPDGADVAAVDWQTVSLGLPARDLSFLCSTGLDTEVRRACEDDVITAYHQALVGHGVAGYSLEQCRDDYAYGMLQAPLIIVFGWIVADTTDRGDTMFLAMTARACAAIREHDTLSRI